MALGSAVLAAGAALTLELTCGLSYLAGSYEGLGSGVVPALLAVWAVLASLTLPLALWAVWPVMRHPAARSGLRIGVPVVLALGAALAAYSRALSRLTPSACSVAAVSDRELAERLSALAELATALPPPSVRLGALVSDAPVECSRPPADAPVTLVATFFERSSSAAVLHCYQGADLGAALGELRVSLEASAVRGPVDVEVVSGTQTLPGRHGWLDAFKLRPGLDGVCQGARCVLPWQLLVEGAFSTYRPLAFIPDLQFGVAPEQLRKWVSAPVVPGVVGLTRLATRSFSIDLGAARPQLTALTRMRRSEVPLTSSALDRAERDAEGYVLAAQLPDGRFRYTLDPITGESDHVGFNLARQAGTTLVLCELGRPTRRNRAAVGKSLASFRPFLREGPELSVLTSDASSSVARIGESALPLVSMLACAAEQRAPLPAATGGLARLLLRLQRADGGFAPALDWQKGQPLDGTEPLYASGQAVLALVLLEQWQATHASAELPPRAVLHEALGRAMDYFAGAYWSHPLRDFFFLEENWHCLAARAALDVHRHSGYEQFCLDYVRFKARLILEREDGVAPDFDGGFGFGSLIPPHNTGAAGFGEAMAAAIPIMEARGRSTADEASSLRRVMGFLLRQQWSRDNCTFCATPDVIGGMSEHTHSSLTRIDFAQHAWAALGHGRRALGAPLR
jgi:hypothetical protein